jgi:hypothetical protein
VRNANSESNANSDTHRNADTYSDPNSHCHSNRHPAANTNTKTSSYTKVPPNADASPDPAGSLTGQLSPNDEYARSLAQFSSNQAMKPKAPLRGDLSMFATTRCRGLFSNRL